MLNLLVELRKFPFLATHQLYNNNQDKRFFDLFFFLVGWMSDGMTDMNGGEDTEAGLRRIWNREEPLIINITHISPHNNVLCPNPIFTDCLTFYPLDISTLQLSSSVINHAFLVFGPNFLSFSMYPSFQFHSHITQIQTNNARESCMRPEACCVQCFLCSWDCVQVGGDILFWVCCVKSDSEIRRDIGQIVLPGLGRCQPTLASRDLKLYHLQLDSMKGGRASHRNQTLFCGNYSQSWTRYFVLLVPCGTLGQSFMDLSLSVACFYRRHEKISNK